MHQWNSRKKKITEVETRIMFGHQISVYVCMFRTDDVINRYGLSIPTIEEMRDNVTDEFPLNMESVLKMQNTIYMKCASWE